MAELSKEPVEWDLGVDLPAKAAEVFSTDSVDAAEIHRRWSVRQAMDKIVGGPLPYDPEVHLYYPNLPHAVQILLRSANHTALLDYRPTSYQAVREALSASYSKLGVTIPPAPFGNRLGRAFMRATVRLP